MRLIRKKSRSFRILGFGGWSLNVWWSWVVAPLWGLESDYFGFMGSHLDFPK